MDFTTHAYMSFCDIRRTMKETLDLVMDTYTEINSIWNVHRFILFGWVHFKTKQSMTRSQYRKYRVRLG